MDVYAETILDHFRNPRGKNPVVNADISHKEANHSCGDTVEIQLKLENGHIAAVGWTGAGCAVSQAAMSILAEELEGMSTGEAEALTAGAIKEMLGIPVSTRRMKCALLGLHTLKNTLRSHRNEQPQSWLETVEVE